MPAQSAEHLVGGAPSAAHVAGGLQQTACIGSASAAISSPHDCGSAGAPPQPNSKARPAPPSDASELKVTVRASPLPRYCLVARSASDPGVRHLLTRTQGGYNITLAHRADGRARCHENVIRDRRTRPRTCEFCELRRGAARAVVQMDEVVVLLHVQRGEDDHWCRGRAGDHPGALRLVRRAAVRLQANSDPGGALYAAEGRATAAGVAGVLGAPGAGLGDAKLESACSR